MFLAGVEKLITENSSIGLFADDIVLWHSSHNIPSIEANLSQCLSRVDDFATNHKLSFNLTKSVTSFFTTNRHLKSVFFPRFVEWAQNEIAVVSDFHKRILFSDEAHFWLNGYVNKQNCRIWSEANPQVYVETPLHPEKLTVWCALWAGGILLQKR
ncbi:hypothetical protein TNCV_4426291 [Trichonephila clavipes]|nr:hypothetical protein TNCV_4426291 [Trichonephila clavipes]